MSKKDKRQPKINYNPANKEIRAHYEPHNRVPRVKEDPESTEHLTPAWQFHRCDDEHTLWGWGKLDGKAYLDIIKNLHGFETMTWNQIKQAAGGRSSGTNNHTLSIDEFVKEAKKRLEELKISDEYEKLFSLRLENKLRLYGIRDGRVLRFIWHDPYHGSKNGAYPTKK